VCGRGVSRQVRSGSAAGPALKFRRTGLQSQRFGLHDAWRLCVVARLSRPSVSSILFPMRIQNAAALLFAAVVSCFAQIPTDQKQPNPPVIPDTAIRQADIAYDKYPETKLDIIRPKAASKEKRPGVLEIHGGGWVNGTKEQRESYTCMQYVEKGFVCASVEYRLAKAALAPAAVEDVLKAAQWFSKNAKKYNVDPKRIVVTGDSAGGHLCLMVGMTPKSAHLGPPARVAAVVNFYGITDVADLLSGPNMRKYAVTWLPEQPGRLELARRVSPMTYVRKNVPPILTFHGDSDQSVPYAQAVRLTNEIKAAGGDARLVTVPGGRHGFPRATLDGLFPQIWEFLREKGILR
jgi:acetyl esterase/lipase